MLTFGTDPEFFVFKNDNLISADQLFPGKHKPHDFGNGQKVFFDGVQGELNVNPATTAAELHANIIAAIQATKDTFEVEDIRFVPTVEVDLEALKDADPECNRFGCDVDFDAYTKKANESDIDATQHPYRYAGGHFHIGGLPDSIMNSSDNIVKFVKMLDVFIGVNSVIRDSSEETKIRRSYQYGKAGSFRVQEYGIEYRPLSNYWVGNEEYTAELVEGAKRALDAVMSGLADKILETFEEDEIRTIINTVNPDRAKRFMEEVNALH